MRSKRVRSSAAAAGAVTAWLLLAHAAAGGDTTFNLQGEFLGSAGPVTIETFEDEPTIGTPNGGAERSIAFDDFTASSVPPAMKVLDVPAFGNHNTTPGGEKYLSADTDSALDSLVTLRFDYPIDRVGFFIIDNEQGMNIVVNGVTYFIAEPDKVGEDQYFGIISENPFTEILIDALDGDSHVSFDDVAYTPEPPCFLVAAEQVVCHDDGASFTYAVQGTDACSGTPSSYSFTAAGGAVGEDLCFTLLVTDAGGGLCCATERCVAVPDCAPPPPAADLDHDGAVTMADLLALLAAWGACPDPDQCPADLDADGTVGPTDLLTLLATW